MDYTTINQAMQGKTRIRVQGTGFRGQVPPKEEGDWSMFCNMPCVDLSPFCGENRPGFTYQKAGLEVPFAPTKFLTLPGLRKIGDGELARHYRVGSDSPPSF